MLHFYQTAFIEALGWTLVDSFWKMGSLWIAYTIITGNGKWFSAGTKYILAIIFMMLGTVWSFFPLPGYYNNILAGREISTFIFYLRENIAAVSIVQELMPFLSLAYFAMVIFFMVRLLYQYRSGQNLLRKNISPVGIDIQNIVHDLLNKIGLRKKIAIFFSDLIKTPLTVGFIKPVILLPVAMFNQLNMEQASSVIAHELIHITRNDYLINILISISGIILFFNPFAKLFQNTIKREREHTCDDYVMAMGFDNWQYAHALYLLGRHAVNTPAFALPATGQRPLLLERISRIMKRPFSKKARISGMSIAKPVVVFFLCLVVSFFHKEPQKASEVIAINQVADAGVQQLQKVPEAGAATTAKKSILNHEAATRAVRRPPKFTPEIAATAAQKPISSLHIKTSRIKTIVTKEVAAAKAPEKISSGEPIPSQSLILSNSDGMIRTFVSRPEKLTHFTLIIPEPPAPPVAKADMDALAPYVPPATFYYSIIVDSLSQPGKVIHL